MDTKKDKNITSSVKTIKQNYLETTEEAGTRTENEAPLRGLMVLSEGILDSLSLHLASDI